MKCLQLQGQEGEFSRLSSFICEFDEDESFSDQDLHAIQTVEAQFQSFLPNKRPLNPNEDHNVAGIASTTTESYRRIRRRLPQSLLALQHPLAFSSSPCQGYSRMTLPVMKFGGQIMYSKMANEVEKAAMELSKVLEAKKREMAQIVLGFDIEWRATFRKGVSPGKVAVMQICDGTDHCHVLHIIHSGIPRTLQLLLEDPTVLKVGAGIANDARKVFKDYGISIKGVEDLSFHANQKLDGDIRKWGLASLTEKLLSKQLQKPSKIRLGNWETRPLSKEQLQYAATDAFASWYLYQVIRDLPDAQVVVEERGDVEVAMQQK